MNHARLRLCSTSIRSAGSTFLFAILAMMLGVRGAAAQTTYGTLSNFDVFNDTGGECHGFEIELDGVSSQDVSYTFGAPYERYGDPKLVELPGGVFVRYESSYDAVNHVFTQTTPLAPSVITPTDGHACWSGGSADYPTSGCEHFGIGINGNPTSTVYRWLVADPAVPGALQPSGTKVSIPAPLWNVVPPAPGGAGPVVQAVLPAVPAEVNSQYGEALWVKVFVTESPDPADLNHLVTDDPAVPNDAAETEVEWTILQAGPNGAANGELANEGQVGAGNESVTRRYEFYQYTGAYDPENHEVMCGGDGGCNTPLDGELGNYIGAQMAAVNLAPLIDTPTETPTPTDLPTPADTATPAPTDTPTAVPTDTPTAVPTDTPTAVPTDTPTAVPTDTPTAVPTSTPTTAPTNTPTAVPTNTAPALTPTATRSSVATRTKVAMSTPTSRPTKPARTATASRTRSPEADDGGNDD